MTKPNPNRKVVPIDKGVPYTPRKPGRQAKYPWASMEVGDSFLFDKLTYSSALKTSHVNSKRFGKHFKAGRVEGGIRCWRLK